MGRLGNISRRIFLEISLIIFSFSALAQANNFYTIEELNQRGFTFGTYETEGYVADIYTCPPCAPGYECKPCWQDYIVVVQGKDVPLDSQPNDKKIVIFTDEARTFEIGKKYSFLAQILDVKTTNQKLNNMKLIYAQSLEAPQPVSEKRGGLPPQEE